MNQSLQQLASYIILWASKFTIGAFVSLGFWLGSLLAGNLFVSLGRRADINTGYVLKVIGRALGLVREGFFNAFSRVDGHA